SVNGGPSLSGLTAPRATSFPSASITSVPSNRLSSSACSTPVAGSAAGAGGASGAAVRGDGARPVEVAADGLPDGVGGITRDFAGAVPGAAAGDEGRPATGPDGRATLTE